MTWKHLEGSQSPNPKVASAALEGTSDLFPAEWASEPEAVCLLITSGWAQLVHQWEPYELL